MECTRETRISVRQLVRTVFASDPDPPLSQFLTFRFHFRQLLDSQLDMQYLPYIGLYLADITFIKDGPGSKVCTPVTALARHVCLSHFRSKTAKWVGARMSKLRAYSHVYAIVTLCRTSHILPLDAPYPPQTHAIRNSVTPAGVPDPELQKYFAKELYAYAFCIIHPL